MNTKSEPTDSDPQTSTLIMSAMYGIPFAHLMNAHVGIAQRAAVMFSKAQTSFDSEETTLRYESYFDALVNYASGELTELQAEAICHLAELYRYPGQVTSQDLQNLAKLVQLHGRFSAATEENSDLEDWRTELETISNNLLFAFDARAQNPDDERVKNLLETSLIRLSEMMPSLFIAKS